jgi:hypothetical protein
MAKILMVRGNGSSWPPPQASEALWTTADSVVAMHRATGGATVSIREGNLVGHRGFAVSVFPNRTHQLVTPPTPVDVGNFLCQNLDLLVRLNTAVGSWLDAPAGLHHLDVVVCPRDRSVAIDLARRFNQRSIFDLDERREISVSRPSEAPGQVAATGWARRVSEIGLTRTQTREWSSPMQLNSLDFTEKAFTQESGTGISRGALGPILTPGRDLVLRIIPAVPKRAVRRAGERVFFIDLDCGNFHELGPCHELYEVDGYVIAVLRAELRLRCSEGTDILLEPGVWAISPAR